MLAINEQINLNKEIISINIINQEIYLIDSYSILEIPIFRTLIFKT